MSIPRPTHVTRLLALVAALLGTLVLGAGPGAPVAPAAQCGLPDATWYIEYASESVLFRDPVFKRPGLILAAERKDEGARALRSAGVAVIYWESNLANRVGTVGAPFSPGAAAAEATETLKQAREVTGCQAPVVGINELWAPGGSRAMDDSTAGYRQAVLSYLQALAAAGARPFLAVPGQKAPTAGGAAAYFWQQAAAVADLVQEVYFVAPTVAKQGPIVGSRNVRIALRQAAAAWTALGIPPTRIGIMLGFQSRPGEGGREGLQPLAAWLEFVKLQALAGKAVADDLGLGSVWSWGWGTFNIPGSADPDKPAAACVYLWARDPNLCQDAPNLASFNPDRNEGQISLPETLHCGWNGGRVTLADVNRTTKVLGANRPLALKAAYEMATARTGSKPSSKAIGQAEKLIVQRTFKGSGGRYRRSLRGRKVSRRLARSIIGDQLSRRALAKRPGGFAGWLKRTQAKANLTLVCQKDEMPAAGDVNLASSLKFLRLPGAAKKKKR